MELQGFSRLLRCNAKITLNLNTAAALVLTALAPLIFSFAYIPYRDMAKVAELYLSTMGILLFGFIPLLEAQDNVEELVYPRPFPHVFVVLLRIVMSMAIAFVFIASVLLLARAQGADFPLLTVLGGTWISAFCLGIVSFTINNLTGQLPAGYLAGFGYYIFEFATRGKYTAEFYLFGLLKNDFASKWNILLAALLLLAVNLVIIYRKS